MEAVEIKRIRADLGMTQEAFADALGVSFATVNRWENGKSKPQRDRIERIKSLFQAKASPPRPVKVVDQPMPPRLDFEGDADAIKLVVDAHRLQNGHLFNKAFGLELSRVVPLPHQRIAVYEHLVPQNPLRFLLADDAGAGKTIMAGLYIREMINRGRLRRVLICCPAGLTWNWRRELAYYFDLDFTILRSSDLQRGQPLDEPGDNLFIISVDTAATDGVKQHLVSEATGKFDLLIFDEAHKLSWADPDRPDSKTRRYRLAEELGARCTHLMLLTATPHMGKQFPYFALWRLLDPRVLSTLDAFISLTAEKRSKFFIRRLKEEMVDYEGQPIYKPRLCQTISYRLTDAEQHFYEEASEYLRWSFETNRRINQSAASMVVAVLQRRLASSNYAMLESLKHRRQRIVNAATAAPVTTSLERLASYFDTSTADDNASEGEGRESEETFEDEALALLCPAGSLLNKELEYLDRVITLGEQIHESLKETKFLKLRELIESAEFHNQQLLIFTEHRDTLEFLRRRFEALGYTGQVASIHGGMAVEEREEQRIFFMPPEERRKQGVGNPHATSARIMLATDAAGEGINLQFAWVMINYDIPWNPARLEQRMGRLHRFGQKHPEVRIFNLVAEGTREGDVLATLLNKLEEARKELCTDKVFDVIGQQLLDISLRDLLRQALFESVPYSAQRKFESMFATQRLRASVEELRKNASTYGDVARRLGQLNTERVVEEFHRLLPAFVQNFVERAAPRAGVELEGDLAEAARFTVGADGDWLRKLGEQFPQGLPDYLTVRRDFVPQGVERDRIAFLRPGDVMFDALCAETLRRYAGDSQRGAVFRDPAAEKPYYVAVYVCQMGESRSFSGFGTKGSNALERRLIAVRWEESGELSLCAPNHVLALQAAPRALTWKAGALLRNPEGHVSRADAWARMFAETNYLQQLRTALRAETETRMDDLVRGYDYRGGELAEKRSGVARRLRQGEAAATVEIEEVKKQQAALEVEKAQALVFEQRRAELLEILEFERLAVAIVIPDPTPEAQESFDKDIETIAMRIARNFEIDHHQARVFDVSSPHLARGYDLESHRANGEKVVIEVKGRAGRGSVQLTDNEWPTAANIRDKYWLYVVVDCATEPKLFRVCDPIRLAFKTRQTITLNIGDIITEAEHD